MRSGPHTAVWPRNFIPTILREEASLLKKSKKLTLFSEIRRNVTGMSAPLKAPEHLGLAERLQARRRNRLFRSNGR
jgi:hypothetical protein